MSGSGAPKLILVSPGTENELFPRVARARALAPELQKSWQVEMVQGPRAGETPTTAGQRARARVERRLARQIALDEYEVRSRRRFGRWRPSGDLALLVVWPYSASVAAARRLAPARIPYVVDAGDPWVLTAVDGSGGGLAHRRRVAAERRLWEGAAGAILTTARQESALRELFPNLPTLVQPSGYRAVDVGPTPRRWLPGEPLELGHFGALYPPRIDFVPLLGRMSAAGPWQELVLHQFGAVASELPDRLPNGVRIEMHDPVPWREVGGPLGRLHAVVVIGNVNPAQLPSKAIDYGALPLPRIALVANATDDATAAHVAPRPGWLVIGASGEVPAAELRAHVARAWAAEELAPMPGDSWAAAGARIRSFLERLVDSA